MLSLFPQPSETIAGSIQALRQGKVGCQDLVEKCLAQIEVWEPKVHAWVSVDREAARRLARHLDDEGRSGKWRGPLHGIPLGIKDIIDMAGLPTGAGSRQMAISAQSKDATLVRKLREAGAILIGKTVTTQFACFDPPPTRNPWNLDHTPGGSSSGSAAAVATGMCLGAIGSQTGGSITRPATYCGVCGCKPTHGRVSLFGIVPLCPPMDHPGPIARSVTDLSILFDVIAGYDADDPYSASTTEPPVDLFGDLTAPISSPRLARLRGFFENSAQPEMRSALETALARFRAAGATVVEGELPAGFADVHRQHRVILEYELAKRHKTRIREFRDDYLPGLAGLIEEGLGLSEVAYQEARRHHAQTGQDVDVIFRDNEIAVCPAAPGPAPDLSTTGDPSFNSPWSYTGLPTVSLPIALTKEGLPVGIQLVAKRFDERRLFRAARWCEQILREPETTASDSTAN